MLFCYKCIKYQKKTDEKGKCLIIKKAINYDNEICKKFSIKKEYIFKSKKTDLKCPECKSAYLNEYNNTYQCSSIKCDYIRCKRRIYD